MTDFNLRVYQSISIKKAFIETNESIKTNDSNITGESIEGHVLIYQQVKVETENVTSQRIFAFSVFEKPIAGLNLTEPNFTFFFNQPFIEKFTWTWKIKDEKNLIQ